MAATSALLPAYLELLESGRWDGVGPAALRRRMASWIRPGGTELSAELIDLLGRWRLPAGLGPSGPALIDAERLAARAWTAWGPPLPALDGLARTDLVAFYQRAFDRTPAAAGVS
jgi:hypothetical protein